MSQGARIELEWADGEHSFALLGKQIEELESISQNPATGRKGIGVGAIWLRIMGSDWYLSDIKNILRLGLIGGGMGAVEAKRMVEMYVDGAPISPLAPGPNNPLTVAQAVIAAAVIGVNLQPASSPAEEEDDDDQEGELETPEQ